jgi:hypothetical protein
VARLRSDTAAREPPLVEYEANPKPRMEFSERTGQRGEVSYVAPRSEDIILK